MSGLPPSSRNCLGNGRPMRLPTPPASTIIPIFMRTSVFASGLARSSRRLGWLSASRVPRGPARRSRGYHPRRWKVAPGARRSTSSRSAGSASSCSSTCDPSPARRSTRPACGSQQAGGRSDLPPTHAAVDGDLLRVRINVMQGPDLQPLRAGRWRLMTRPRPGRPPRAAAHRRRVGGRPGPRRRRLPAPERRLPRRRRSWTRRTGRSGSTSPSSRARVRSRRRPARPAPAARPAGPWRPSGPPSSTPPCTGSSDWRRGPAGACCSPRTRGRG